MAKLESLIIDMQLESAQLRKGLDEIKKKLDETAKHAEGLLNFEVLKEVGHLAVEAGEKLAEFVHHGAEVADQMGKMAQTAGTSVESFSRLAYAAGLSNVSNEDLGVAFKKLNGNISEAAPVPQSRRRCSAPSASA
jgi:methyl-accepting chemotaxis protein